MVRLFNNRKNQIPGSRALAARAHPGSRASYFLMRAGKKLSIPPIEAYTIYYCGVGVYI